MKKLLKQIRECTLCETHLEHGTNPVVAFSKKSKIIIVGQAPGRVVHESGVPWDDQSGENLRGWLGVTSEQFYDETLFGIVPMGFCYPGTGKSGDLPPRKECAEAWHDKINNVLPKQRLTLLVGMYAQKYYLGKEAKRTLTETVRGFEEYWPQYLPLPHPSPRNNIWMKKNPWFATNVLPKLKTRVMEYLGE